MKQTQKRGRKPAKAPQKTRQATSTKPMVVAKPHQPQTLSAQATRFKEVETHIESLRNALQQLTQKGLCIITVDCMGGRGKPLLEMAPSPYLYQLCKPVNIGQKQVGNTSFSRWLAEFCGVSLVWWDSVRRAA